MNSLKNRKSKAFKYNHVLVTGSAGFIGYHLSKRLLQDGCTVIGVDSLNPYYEVALKKARLERLLAFDNFFFLRSIFLKKRPWKRSLKILISMLL